MSKRLAVFTMPYNRVITAFVLKETDTYYLIQVVKVESQLRGDWQENDEVKISKSLIKHVQWKD